MLFMHVKCREVRAAIQHIVLHVFIYSSDSLWIKKTPLPLCPSRVPAEASARLQHCKQSVTEVRGVLGNILSPSQYCLMCMCCKVGRERVFVIRSAVPTTLWSALEVLRGAAAVTEQRCSKTWSSGWPQHERCLEWLEMFKFYTFLLLPECAGSTWTSQWGEF